MMPNEDPTWPICSPEPCGDFRADMWCQHVRTYLHNRKDTSAIQPGNRYCVPVVPMHGQYAEVGIDVAEMAPGIAGLYLVKGEPFSQEETIIDLGLWNEGEGRLSMAQVVDDWITSQDEKVCAQSTHSYAEELAVAKYTKGSKTLKKANQWELIISGMCIPCHEKYQQNIANLNSGFGLSGLDDSSKSSPTFNALSQRFGNASRT